MTAPLLLALALAVPPAPVELRVASNRTSASARHHGLYLMVAPLAGVEATAIGRTIGGVGGGISSGLTPISGGTASAVCFNDAGVMNCGDTGFLFDKTANTITVLGNIELGHASANTLSASGGVLSVEGATLLDGALTATRIPFASDANTLADDADLTYASDILTLGSAGAGTAAIVLDKTMGGGSTTDNWLNITGTLPTTLTAATRALLVSATTAGSSSQNISGIFGVLNAGYTGSSATTGVSGSSAAAGTGITILGANAGIGGSATGTTAGYNIGNRGQATSSSVLNIGTSGAATNATNSPASNVGIYGAANLATNNIGVFGELGTITAPTVLASAAVVGNNGAIAAPIARFHDNGAAAPSTGPTATWTVLDGANAQAGNMVLTSATMTAENQALVTGSAIHSYTWTNAQVVALGAATTGDISVATLPAKTVVKNAYVVITGAAAGPATVTVACGRTGAGYTDYIVASDAKAAANTVYGDASAERGTNLVGYDLPSYTGTTTINCHFISTVANLDQVTGSTGRVILETSLVP